MNLDRAKTYKQNVESNPLHQYIGLKIESMEKGEARIVIPVDGNTRSASGHLHGGVIYLVSDVAAFTALGPILDNGEYGLTIDIQCSIFRGTKNGIAVFQAQVTNRSRRLATMDVKVNDSEGNLVAECRVTKAITSMVPEAFRT